MVGFFETGSCCVAQIGVTLNALASASQAEGGGWYSQLFNRVIGLGEQITVSCVWSH